jgi:hypothetical protein
MLLLLLLLLLRMPCKSTPIGTSHTGSDRYRHAGAGGRHFLRSHRCCCCRILRQSSECLALRRIRSSIIIVRIITRRHGRMGCRIGSPIGSGEWVRVRVPVVVVVDNGFAVDAPSHDCCTVLLLYYCCAGWIGYSVSIRLFCYTTILVLR